MATQSVPVPRIALEMPDGLIERVDAFCAAAGFPSRSAGIRALISAGLKVAPGPAEDPRNAEMLSNRMSYRSA
jgi:metal-responsive CopG/Arc/MetJ family transcriptional regulator